MEDEREEHLPGDAAAPPAVRHDEAEDAKHETEEARCTRHSVELIDLSAHHASEVDRLHAALPLPRGVKYADLTKPQKRRWNEKRKRIDKMNREYFRRVRETCERHRVERASARFEFKKQRAEQAKKEASTDVR